MPLLGAGPGVIQYNGVSFGLMAVTTRFQGVPKYDQAQRTVVATTFTLGVKDRIVGSPTDAAVQLLVTALTQPGAALVYSGRGVGNVTINAGGKQDVEFGPKPRLVAIKPLGRGNACILEWEVEFTIPTCSDSVTKNFPMEWNAEVSWDVDRSGYTTRTIEGHLVIPLTRRNVRDRFPYTSADEWREEISPPHLEGFYRTPGRFSLSADGRTLKFQIVDTEGGPNFPPRDVVAATAEHTYSANPNTLLKVWSGTISAEYEIARGAVNGVKSAWDAFFELVESRQVQLRNAIIKNDKPMVGALGIQRPKNPNEIAFVPLACTVSEPEIYGRTKVKISLTYLVPHASLAAILESGLWTSVGGGWTNWNNSVAQHLHPRGIARLKWTPGDSAIVDLCGKKPPPRPVRPVRGLPPVAGPGNFDQVFPFLSPRNSWVSYNTTVKTTSDSQTSVVNTLPENPITSRSTSPGGLWDAIKGEFPDNAQAKTAAFPLDGELYEGNRKAESSVTAQRRGSPVTYLTLSGFAIRVGYPVPPPRLLEVDGMRCVAINTPGAGGFNQSVIGGTFGAVVFGAAWELPFLVEGELKNVVVPPNPLV